MVFAGDIKSMKNYRHELEKPISITLGEEATRRTSPQETDPRLQELQSIRNSQYSIDQKRLYRGRKEVSLKIQSIEDAQLLTRRYQSTAPITAEMRANAQFIT